MNHGERERHEIILLQSDFTFCQVSFAPMFNCLLPSQTWNCVMSSGSTAVIQPWSVNIDHFLSTECGRFTVLQWGSGEREVLCTTCYQKQFSVSKFPGREKKINLHYTFLHNACRGGFCLFIFFINKIFFFFVNKNVHYL